jgi:UDP-N-acetylglucosamine:LPS N-acetylglucosamine transferase
VESPGNDFVGGASVLFFSRGRGHGHAIPDMAIADELARLRPGTDLRFVSYGTGAATFRAHGRIVIDLEMPDDNPLWRTVIGAGELIAATQPRLVISHEEFAALPVARIFGVPTIFITEWFSDPEHQQMQALVYADHVICIEEPGIFDEPPCVEGKVFYAGPVVRRFEYSRADRGRARRELGLAQDATLILVVPGGWATEQREPIFDLVVPAFDALKAPDKVLVWMAGEDCEMLRERLDGHEDVIVKDRDWQIDRWMVASDLAVTKANRVTLRELAALGIPSVSISHGHNPVDDVLIERISTNTPLDARTVNSRMLARTILDILREASEEKPPVEAADSPPAASEGAELAARRLAHHIDTVAERRAVHAPALS